MAGSRGPALFVPIAVVGYLILHYGLRSIRTTLGIIAVGLCIAGILRWVPSPAIERIRENPFEKGKSGLVRIGNYNKAISSWQENEIWGLGTGGFGEYYPHNIFLEFGVENGIISVVIFATWIIVIIKKYFKLDRRYFLDEELRLIDWAFCAFIYGLLNAQVSGSLITNDWVWYGGIFCYRIVDLAREKALMEERRALLKPI
jgi:O-antigen ligase